VGFVSVSRNSSCGVSFLLFSLVSFRVLLVVCFFCVEILVMYLVSRALSLRMFYIYVMVHN